MKLKLCSNIENNVFHTKYVQCLACLKVLINNIGRSVKKGRNIEQYF